MAIKRFWKLVPLFVTLAVTISSCQFSNTRAPAELKAKVASIETKTPVFTLKDLEENQNFTFLPSTGEQKLLVLPIQFVDNAPTGTDIAKFPSDLDIAFNGTDDQSFTTRYPLFTSVKDYYETSSYGQLKLKFVVPEAIYNAPWTQAEYQARIRMYPDRSTEFSTEIIHWAYLQYRETTLDTTYYNSVIGIYYSDYNKFNSVERNLFWAYTCTFYNTYERAYDNYVWASYYFLFEFAKYGLDTHTYIHELGHLFGIHDYYRNDNSLYSASGLLDMMSGNVGDHNAFTKYLLGWIDPMTPGSEGMVELRPYASSGDALIIGHEWNGTAYDNYLIITYYTPTGLNARDIEYPDYRMYRIPGILIYQVDARLAQLYPNGNARLLDPKEIATFKDSGQDLVIYHSNTPSYSYAQNKNNFLLEIVDARGKNYALEGYAPKDSILFQEGSAFGVGKYENFTLHDKTPPDFKIYIDLLTEEKAVLYVGDN